MDGTAGRARTRSVGRYRRAGATAAALVLAGGLTLGGCSASGGSSSSSAAKAPEAAANNGAAAAGAPTGAPAGAGAGAGSSDAAGTAGSAGKPGTAITPPADTGRSIIYTGEIQLLTKGSGGVNGVDAAVARAEQLVRGAGGFIDSEVSGDDTLLTNSYNGYQPEQNDSGSAVGSVPASGGSASAPLPSPTDVGGQSAQLVLRIPVDSYDTVYQQLLTLGTVLAHQRQAQDVTQQVVDISSRVKTQQASVARVRTLMDRATTIGDVTTLEQDLTQREADLESLESQLAALKSETAMSTVTVQLYSKATPVQAAPAKHGLSVLGALKNGWHALYETVRALLIALAAALPFLVPLGLLLWLVRVLMRRRTVPVHPLTRAPRPGGPDAAAAYPARPTTPPRAEPEQDAEQYPEPTAEQYAEPTAEWEAEQDDTED
ncbi:DUF4349 domain-containing protein [Streptacidiphilus cavernicola]|uniref:DUF4349 domain-containing protein n=1 Tax=Streptacidiphilus cavernicola TaxID=3342716 RepID=A0ABV6W4D3_9ACTN